MKRREFLGTAAAAAALSAMAPPSLADNHSGKPSIVLVHGAWHGAWAWNDVVPLLLAAGHPTYAVELPGAGTKTTYPVSLWSDPFDAAAYGAEPTAIKDLTQQERTDYTIQAVKAAAAASGNGKVVLIGHSLGGLTIMPVAEAVPELIQDLIFLTAFLIPNGKAAGDSLEHESFAAGQLGPLFAADPGKTGTLRINPRSNDQKYIDQAQTTFYADVPDERLPAIFGMLHTDEPATITSQKQNLTSANFGSIDRHFILMEDDNTIPAAAQEFMVVDVDSSGIGGETTVHRMAGSHSPFFAQPEKLAATIMKIAE